MKDQERKPIVVDSPQQQRFIDERETTVKGSGKHNQSQRSKPKTVDKTVIKEKLKTEAKPKKKKEQDPEADYTDADADPAPPMYESDSESEAGEDEESDSDMSDGEEKKIISKELRAPAAPASSSKRSSSSATPTGEGLSRDWKKTKTTGKGVDMLEKIADLFDEQDAKQNSDRVGFLQVRFVDPKSLRWLESPRSRRRKTETRT